VRLSRINVNAVVGWVTCVKQWAPEPDFSTFNPQSFVLPAAGAGQDKCHFTGCFVKLRRKPQPVRPALEASLRELAKRTVPGCLGRLIILPPLEIARRIHPRIVFSRPAKRCPSHKLKTIGGNQTALPFHWLTKARFLQNGFRPRVYHLVADAFDFLPRRSRTKTDRPSTLAF
jgi:hypothetical protein